MFQEKAVFFSPSILILATAPSKDNIAKIAQECVQGCRHLSREDALELIEALHEAEASHSCGIGEEIAQLIAVAEENLRFQVRMAG